MASYQMIRHVVIHGRVQRVGYRAWTEYVAPQLDIEGWVRNRRDGTVEALFAGSRAAVTAMVEACRHGPAKAQVDTIDQDDGTPDDLALRHPGERFSVLPTA